MKKLLAMNILFWILMLSGPVTVQAGSLETDLSDYDFSNIEQHLRENTQGMGDVTFSGLVKQLVTGDIKGAFGNLGGMIQNTLFDEINTNKKVLVQLMLVAVISAIFTNFSDSFSSSYVGDTGFFVTYLLIFSMLAASFMMMVTVAKDTIGNVLDFMRALIPCYALAITVSSGVTSSAALYQGLMIAITIANWIILKVVVPLASVYFVLELVNNMEKEERFTKLTELIKSITGWLLKTVVACIVGLHMIQSLLLPAIDSVKNTALQKGIQAIPGAGKAAGAVLSTMIGSGVVIKNSIGIAGLMMILFMVSVPFLKLGIFVLGYRLTAALLQPVSDERIVNCINSTSEGAKVLLESVISVAALFMLSIALIAASTNISYYAG